MDGFYFDAEDERMDGRQNPVIASFEEKLKR